MPIVNIPATGTLSTANAQAKAKKKIIGANTFPTSRICTTIRRAWITFGGMRTASLRSRLQTLLEPTRPASSKMPPPSRAS